MTHNQRQKLNRLVREIDHFAGVIKGRSHPANPREAATITRSNRCLMRRCRDLDKLMRSISE